MFVLLFVKLSPESESESKSLVGEESQLWATCEVFRLLLSNLGITSFRGPVVFLVNGEGVKEVLGGGGSIFLVKAVICTVSSPGPEHWRSVRSRSSQSLLRRS